MLTFADDFCSMLERQAAAMPMPCHHSPRRSPAGLALRRSQPNNLAPCSMHSTRLREEWGMFFSGSSAGSLRLRSSIGSRLTASASSSIADSSASIPTASPGARIEPASIQSSSTRSWVIKRLAPPYMKWVATPAGSKKPSPGRLETIVSCAIALMRPPASAPSLIRCSVLERRTVASNTCWRDITHLTGRSSRLAAIAAATLSGAMPSLAPKPPPM